MKDKIEYTDEPMGELRIVPDFLPSPQELVLKKEKRSAIFGKLSIVSFFALVALVVTAIILAEKRNGLSDSAEAWAGITGYSLFLVGFMLGYLSALKQETPKCYRYIGFLLHFISLLFLPGCMLG